MQNRLTRKDRAIAIRDAVLPWLQQHGDAVTVGGARFVAADLDKFKIMHRTPFGGRDQLAARSYAEALYLQQHGSPNLPYGLEILSAGGKVMNIEWDDNGRTDLVSFRPEMAERFVEAFGGNSVANEA